MTTCTRTYLLGTDNRRTDLDDFHAGRFLELRHIADSDVDTSQQEED